MSTTPAYPTPPLTTLSEDEAMFRDAVRDFAEAEVRPLVDRMERTAELEVLLPRRGLCDA